jgi:hypothetical protein
MGTPSFHKTDIYVVCEISIILMRRTYILIKCIVDDIPRGLKVGLLSVFQLYLKQFSMGQILYIYVVVL